MHFCLYVSGNIGMLYLYCVRQVQALIQGRASAWQQNLVLTPTKAGAGEAVRSVNSLLLVCGCIMIGGYLTHLRCPSCQPESITGGSSRCSKASDSSSPAPITLLAICFNSCLSKVDKRKFPYFSKVQGVQKFRELTLQHTINTK